MKILYIIDDFPPVKYTSSSTLTYNLAKKFLDKGHEVFVITSVQNREQAGQKIFNGIKVFRIYTPAYNQRWNAYFGLFNPKIFFKFKKIIKIIKPDISHAQHIHQYLSLAVLKLAKKYSRAVFLTAHDVRLFHYAKLIEFINQHDLSIPKKFNYKINWLQQIKRFKWRFNPTYQITIRNYLKNVDKIFAVSHALKNALNQNKIKNVKVIHNGLNLVDWEIDLQQVKNFKNKFDLMSKKVVFFDASRLTLKGLFQLIQALELASQKIPNLTLLLVGKNEISKNLLTKIEIIPTGWVDRKQIKNIFAASDLIIAPSVCFDSFPTVILEGMACKKPVIATCFGGAKEIIIDNKTGYIINPLNIKVFSEKIIDLLNDTKKAESFGENGYLHLKKDFSLETQTEQTQQEYLKALS